MGTEGSTSLPRKFLGARGIRPGVSFACDFVVLLGTNEGFLECIGFTSLANDLPFLLATFMASVKSSATDKIEDTVPRERLDMLSSIYTYECNT